MDVCKVRWDLVEEEGMVYEGMKFGKRGKGELVSKGKGMMNK